MAVCVSGLLINNVQINYIYTNEIADITEKVGSFSRHKPPRVGGTPTPSVTAKTKLTTNAKYVVNLGMLIYKRIRFNRTM